jgi:hypothetical protein
MRTENLLVGAMLLVLIFLVYKRQNAKKENCCM